MSASYKFKKSFIFVLLRLIINYTMSKAVCPSLALSNPIPTWQAVSDRPVVYNNILSFSIVDVTSELLVTENENTISWQKVRYKYTSSSPHFVGQKYIWC
jgi:hypothetical protein